MGRQLRERKYPIFETVAKGDSNPGSLDYESGILRTPYFIMNLWLCFKLFYSRVDYIAVHMSVYKQ